MKSQKSVLDKLKQVPVAVWVVLLCGVIGFILMFVVVHTADDDDVQIPYVEGAPPIWSTPKPAPTP